CASEGIAVSVETYEPEVAHAGLAAGARVLNLTGAQHQEAMFDLAAEFDATVILCYVKGANVREITDVNLDADPVPGILDHFAQRVEVARQHGVDRIVIDPGMGFYYGNLVDPMTRVRHQAEVIINTFRLRVLGLPICHALPHAFDLFEDHFRTAEGFFAVLATLGGASLFRTHEVPRVAAVVRAMQTLDVGTHWQR
ncbi:MAG: dihydropteroate synthase, partial [Candidatus Nanopelagicales bacterium]